MPLTSRPLASFWPSLPPMLAIFISRRNITAQGYLRFQDILKRSQSNFLYHLNIRRFCEILFIKNVIVGATNDYIEPDNDRRAEERQYGHIKRPNRSKMILHLVYTANLSDSIAAREGLTSRSFNYAAFQSTNASFI